MICIGKITDEDFNVKKVPLNNPRHRFGARGIVFNNDLQIAILNKKIKNEYKLVGGGIEDDEDPSDAFKREVLEETGCKIEIDKCLGTIEEIISLENYRQTSYVFVAHVIENTGKPKYTKKEEDEGASLCWLKIGEALNLIRESENNIVGSKYENPYHSRFIVKRDYKILKYYIENLKN